jgi:signal transduction histidine kinase
MGNAWALQEDTKPCPAGRPPRYCGANTADLHATVQRLRSFNRSVSHDLRGPLGAMGGATRLAIDAITRSDTPRALRLLSATARQAESLARLVNDLLAMAEADEAADERVDLNAALHDALSQLALSADGDRPALSCIQLQSLPPAVGTPGLICQVFVNLIGNALKFSSESSDPRVEIGCWMDADMVTVFVKDNGVGFEPQAASTLFEPFHRLHGSRFPGTGVGLSLVKRIVERHGGRVWAQSQPGAGATFHFTIRAAATRPAGDSE